MNRNIILAVLLSLIGLDLFAAGAAAQNLPPQKQSMIAPAQAKSNSKLSFRLEALARSATLRAASAADQARALSLPAEGPGSLIRDALGKLLVYIRIADLSDAQLQALGAAGAQIVHVAERYHTVTALVDAADLTSIAAVSTVQSVQEELTPMTSGAATLPRQLRPGRNAPTACPGGANVSEGDLQLNAASARSTYSIDGTGVTVGILSDSYDQYASAVTRAITDVTSGDLPGASNPCGRLTAVGVISTSLLLNNIDEGRAMLQIVHDLAPGAALKFASAFNGDFQFADNIRALRTAGSDIIGDDVFYFRDPFFQEGVISVAISDVVGSGALYFTLAGNHNRKVGSNHVASYEAPAYRPATCPAGLPVWQGPDCHDFDPGGGVNNTSAITLANSGKLNINFQFNEPWYGVATDFDLYVLNDSNSIVAQSLYENPLTQTPWEYFSFTNSTGSTQRYRIVINRYSGSATPRIKYMMLQGTSTTNLLGVQYNTSNGGDIVGPTLYGHSATRFGFSVAAVPYSDSNNPETYTSRGPAAHYFGPVVNSSPAAAISAETIQQPDFGATDGGCNTFFGSFLSGCYRFYGTSAATPHAAAIAALLKHKANLMNVPLTRGWAKFVMQSTASPVSGGDVNWVGSGLLNALAAADKLATSKFLFLPLILK